MAKGEVKSRNLCENCFFFVKTINPSNITESQGVCRRYPPTPFPVPTHTGQIGVMTVPATVSGKEWCGEWRQGNGGLIAVN